MASTDCCTEGDAQRRKREAGRVCLWGMSEADWQKRFSLHLHVKWPGCDTAGEWKAAGKNERRFPGQCYVTSSMTDHSPCVCVCVYKQHG